MLAFLPRAATYETFAGFKQRVESAGLKVANIGNSNVHNMPEVTLKRPVEARRARVSQPPDLPGGSADDLRLAKLVDDFMTVVQSRR